MNPLDELSRLTALFPSQPPLIAQAEHVPIALVPEPYRKLLAHDHHMTLAMEEFHGGPVDVQVIYQSLAGMIYSRKILLRLHSTGKVVQYGIVRFDLSYVTEQVQDEILQGQIPLGRILINHNVLRHIDLGAVLKIHPGPELQARFECGAESVTYGRLATIFCNSRPAVDLLEISCPLPEAV